MQYMFVIPPLVNSDSFFLKIGMSGPRKSEYTEWKLPTPTGFKPGSLDPKTSVDYVTSCQIIKILFMFLIRAV